MSGSESRVMALPLSVKATDMKDPHIGLDHCRAVFVRWKLSREAAARST
jgi:hypothetical protein